MTVYLYLSGLMFFFCQIIKRNYVIFNKKSSNSVLKNK